MLYSRFLEPISKFASAGKTRQKQLQKRSLQDVNEHFEATFNAVLPSTAILRWVLLCLWLSAPLICLAKDIDGEYAVFSVGGKTCKDYLQTRTQDSAAQAQYLEWLQGYLSAFNLLMPNTYNILGEHEFNKVIAWLDDHCRSNSNSHFITAAAMLTANLFPTRMNMAPDKDNAGKWSGNDEFFPAE